MDDIRAYGDPPYKVALLHGGPGAAGEMTPVAIELSKSHGVLEPFQTASSLNGQLDELKEFLQAGATPPVSIVGFSWGAMLGFMFAARHPSFVKKLVMVGSPPFDDKHSAGITRTRLSRLTQRQRAEADDLASALKDPRSKHKNDSFARLGQLMSEADAFDPLPHEDEIVYRQDIFERVWKEAEEQRSSGELLAQGRQIHCPVIAIHGDYDPHPAEGVWLPLSRVLEDFTFVQLEKCGHKPWVEKHARDKFYEVLEKLLA